MLVSAVFYLLFWRADNELGAKDFPELLWAAITFLSLGGLGFVSGHVFYDSEKMWGGLFLAWILCIGLLIGAISLSPMLLLLLM